MYKRNSKKSTALDFTDQKTLTEQCHRDEVKIQNIMKRHRTTGLVSHLSKQHGFYADMSSAPDFYTAQTVIAQTKSMFEEIPAKIRKDFDNDPGKFLDFIQNPDNKDQMAEYGFDVSHLDNYEKPLSDYERDQVHLEEMIDQRLQADKAVSLSDASPEQLQAALSAKLANSGESS